MRPELCLPRTISSPAGRARSPYQAWAEVVARVRAVVPAWGFEEEIWVHWAVPFRDGRPEPAAAVRFDPGCRAAAPGEPPEVSRLGTASLDAQEAERLCGALLEHLRPQLHRHTLLGVTSVLNESVEDFRARCARSFRPSEERGRRGNEAAARESSGGAVESRFLSGADLQVLTLRVGVGWYPEGIEPSAQDDDPLVRAAERRGR